MAIKNQNRLVKIFHILEYQGFKDYNKKRNLDK
jgi:hypothetical protein